MQPTKTVVLVSTRIAFGLLFLTSGIDKLLSDFSATGFLEASSGPFSQYFSAMAGNNLVDFLVIFGEIGIGIALIFGVFLSFTAVCGILMMLLFYLASFPPKTGYINLNIMYAFIFLILATFEEARHFSLQPFVTKILRRLFTKPSPATAGPIKQSDRS